MHNIPRKNYVRKRNSNFSFVRRKLGAEFLRLLPNLYNKTTCKIAYAVGCNYDEFFNDCSTASNFFRNAKYSDVLTVT